MRRTQAVRATFAACLIVALLAPPPLPARPREASAEYAARRAKVRAQVDGPVVLFGYTGRENTSPSYIFAQEETFYYLTGHNEEGAALLMLPDRGNGHQQNGGPREILFLQKRNLPRERWDGARVGPDDPGVAQKLGFERVASFEELKGELEKLAKTYTIFYTVVAGQNEAGYPHNSRWNAWLQQAAPGVNLRSVTPVTGAMRQIKSESEMALLTRAIELSMDAHLEAWRMIRPGVWEYEVAARMRFIYNHGGCERDGYAPIVGTGFNSTVLHYNKVDQQIKDGDVVLMDVAGEYAGYSSDITRTVPANGKFTARQREIYDIVLAASDAAIAAIKPGVTLSRTGENSLFKIAYDVINTRGKDSKGEPLGKYFIHGLGHHIGLNVHDAGDPNRPLAPGMVITIEPGIYIPEENLGVRIEDNILVTETGHKLLTARLPRTAPEIEKFMAEAKKRKSAGAGD